MPCESCTVMCYEKQLCCALISEDAFFATSASSSETKSRFMKQSLAETCSRTHKGVNKVVPATDIPNIFVGLWHKLYHRGHLEGNRYIFTSNTSDGDGDSSEEECPLKVYKQEAFLERKVQPGDTLRTLSLQFNCPIAELKRINNIHRDNEIFARRIVKVPARLFTKKLPDVHASSSHKVVNEGSDTCTSMACLTDINNDMPMTSHMPTVEASDRKLDVSNVHSVQFHVGDTVNMSDTNRRDVEDNLAETFDVESSSSPLIPQEDCSLAKNERTMFSCSGADWGLSVLQLIICSLLLGFAGPILYVIYLTEDSKKHT